MDIILRVIVVGSPSTMTLKNKNSIVLTLNKIKVLAFKHWILHTTGFLSNFPQMLQNLISRWLFVNCCELLASRISEQYQILGQKSGIFPIPDVDAAASENVD